MVAESLICSGPFPIEFEAVDPVLANKKERTGIIAVDGTTDSEYRCINARSPILDGVKYRDMTIGVFLALTFYNIMHPCTLKAGRGLEAKLASLCQKLNRCSAEIARANQHSLRLRTKMYFGGVMQAGLQDIKDGSQPN